MSNYYSTCPNCGDNLDPGEHCHCQGAITIARSEEFTAIAHKVDDHLKTLPLTEGQHTRMIELMLAVVAEAEKTAFMQGAETGMVESNKRFTENILASCQGVTRQ